MRSPDELPEVATVIRKGGTSAQKFRDPLTAAGWAVRGTGLQGGVKLPEREPDPTLLFQSGGVEVLEVAAGPEPDLRVNPAAKGWAYVRSPADVFFYSGHAAYWTGKLVWDRGGNPHSRDNWEDFLGPEDLIDFWGKQTPDLQRSPDDLDILIINGCSVLWWEPPVDDGPDVSPYAADVSTPSGPSWKRLLCSDEGPLVALLGYRDLAPLDSGGGDVVAERMAQAMARELKDDFGIRYTQKWLEINQRYGESTWTAAAIDLQGYWYINKK